MKPRHRKIPSKAIDVQMALDSAVVRGADENETNRLREKRDEMFNSLSGWAKIIVRDEP